jgi:transposase
VIMIGVDPHKGSHTAVALDSHERVLAELKVRADDHQTERLLAWAAPFQTRTWAIEGAGGLGYLLAQQLVAVGELVLDVPAMLSARGTAAQLGPDRQKRPQRRPLGRNRRAASHQPARCRA